MLNTKQRYICPVSDQRNDTKETDARHTPILVGNVRLNSCFYSSKPFSNTIACPT